MKRTTAMILLCIFLWVGTTAQEVKSVKNSPFVFPTEQLAIGTATKSTFYVVVKDIKKFFYKTARGSYYYVTKTAKGEFRRVYESSLKGK